MAAISIDGAGRYFDGEFIQFLAWREQEVVAEFDLAMPRLAKRNASYGDDEIAEDVHVAIAEARNVSGR